MPDQSISPELIAVATALETLGQKVRDGWSNDQTLNNQWGWNFPPVTRHDLARMATDIANAIRARSPSLVDEHILERLKGIPPKIQRFQSETITYLYNGHGQQAVPA